MTLLRLLSNSAIMGRDAVDHGKAWRIFDQLPAEPPCASQPTELLG
jgi:hypothetical protein